jgi:hypothetical protein
MVDYSSPCRVVMAIARVGPTRGVSRIEYSYMLKIEVHYIKNKKSTYISKISRLEFCYFPFSTSHTSASRHHGHSFAHRRQMDDLLMPGQPQRSHHHQ